MLAGVRDAVSGLPYEASVLSWRGVRVPGTMAMASSVSSDCDSLTNSTKQTRSTMAQRPVAPL